MYHIDQYPDIIYHLKNNSTIFKDKGDHYMMFCPYCNDATRKTNPEHGHLYVSKSLPVFYCQRCGTGNSILALLYDTDFHQKDIIQELKQFTNFRSIKDHLIHTGVNRVKDAQKIYQYLNEKWMKMYMENQQDYYKINNYLKERLGNVNVGKFLIYPDFVSPVSNHNELSCCFLNYRGLFTTARFIESNTNWRFFKNKQGEVYHFQPYDFDKYKTIVITEGVFDVINLALFNNKFSLNSTFYLAMLDKKYTSTVKNLIIAHLLLGEYDINLIFDNEVNVDNIKFQSQNIINTFNNSITINYWKPEITKDVGEIPTIRRV